MGLNINMIKFSEWLLLKEASQIQWTMPNIQDEMGELNRTAKTLNINPQQLTQATKTARLVPLDDNTWAKMSNTDSWNIKSGDMDSVNSLAKGYGRDATSIAQGFQSGSPMPAPIVLSHKGSPYLVGGNTRLMVARAMGIRPSMLHVAL